MHRINMTVIHAKALAFNLGCRVKTKGGREGVLTGVCRDEYCQDLWDAQVLLDGDDYPDAFPVEDVVMLLKKKSHPMCHEVDDVIDYTANDFQIQYTASGKGVVHGVRSLGFAEVTE